MVPQSQHRWLGSGLDLSISAQALNKSNSIPAVAEMAANPHCTFCTFTSPVDAAINKA